MRKDSAKRLLSLSLAGVLVLGAAGSAIAGVVFRYRQNHYIASASTLISTKGSFSGEGACTENAVKAYRKFGVELFCAVDDKQHNALISNLSAYLAIAILSQGAAGESKQQLLSLLGLSQGELWDFALYLYRHYSDNETFRDIVRVANGLWIREREDFTVKRAFLSCNADYFGADIYCGAFNQKTISAVNDWVSYQTAHKIKKMIDKISQDTMLFLINTVLVESDWRDVWENYEKMTFSSQAGEKRVDGLFRTQDFYYDSGNALAFTYELYGGLSFMGVLPNGPLEEYAFDEAEMERLLSSPCESHEEEINGERWAYRYTAHCRLPKFSYSYETSLNDAIAAMGAPVIFDRTQADFSDISETLPLFVGEIKHKTFVDVNKKGVSVAGSTSIEIMDGACAPDFPDHEVVKEVNIFLDRPFLYMIYEKETGLPLFIGSVYEL